MAEPLTIGAAVLGLVGTTVALATRLWPSTPAEPRATVVPPAPAHDGGVQDERIAVLRRDVDELRRDLPRIRTALTKMEAELDRREEDRAKRGGGGERPKRREEKEDERESG